jgi:DNA-binding MarR family transcriptional regulator
MVREGSPARSQVAVVVALAATLTIGLAFEALSSAEEEQPILELGYAGSGPAGREFARVAANRTVQRALLDVAAAPRSPEYLDAALKGTGVTPDQLQSLQLIRLNGGRYELSFSLLTLEDRQKIQAAAEREGARLAAGILEHRPRIETLLKTSSMPSTDWRAMAFFVLGCVSLDWDGLNWISEKGYWTDPGKGGYVPTATQPLPREARRQLYWGSHNYTDRAAVTTFGDHYSVPRMGLPDVFSRATLDAPEPIKSSLARAAVGMVRRQAAALMLALRDGPKNADELVSATGSRQVDVKDVLDLLLALEYVTESKGVYTAVIPVLTERDRPMVRELRLLGREAIAKWFEERYEPLRSALADLTPQRYGVPLSSSFYWVWHPLFGVANRELVAADLFADPYDAKRTFQGFIPAVYLLDVVQGPF